MTGTGEEGEAPPGASGPPGGPGRLVLLGRYESSSVFRVITLGGPRNAAEEFRGSHDFNRRIALLDGEKDGLRGLSKSSVEGRFAKLSGYLDEKRSTDENFLVCFLVLVLFITKNPKSR